MSRRATRVRSTCFLTDLVMPGMNGRELADRLRTTRPETRVLYMSGYTGEAIARQGGTQGLPFLEKPFTTAALARRVRDILDGPARDPGPRAP